MNRTPPTMPAKLLVAAAAACAVVLGATACSDTPTPTPTPTTSSTPAAQTPPIPLPSPADLNAGMLIEFNPNVPAANKVGLIQGADADPDLVNRMAGAAASNGVKMVVTQVNYVGNNMMQAGATMSVNGQAVAGMTTIPFVAEGGRWKLQKAWVCQMLANAAVTSPACP